MGGVIRLLHNDKKSDVQYMRNTGLKEATGKVIIFFDARRLKYERANTKKIA